MSTDKIRRYLTRAPEAISGQGGHNTTLRVARSLYNGFGLSREQVFDWLRVYNTRLTDKWTVRELEHKADSAASGTYDRPRGWMLSTTETTVLSYSQCSAMVRETAVHAPKYHPKGTKIGPVFTREACFTTETTVVSESQCSAYARARSPQWEWKRTVVTDQESDPPLSPVGVEEAPKWTEEQIREEHRPFWRMSSDGKWHPLNDAAREAVQDRKNPVAGILAQGS